MANINIKSPITEALQGLQGMAMDIWQQNQRYKQSEETKKLSIGASSLETATKGLSNESSDEDFKIALDHISDWKGNKYLGKTAGLIEDKVESMRGIAQERTKTIDDFNVRFDAAKKAAGEWNTDDMPKMLQDLRGIRFADLDYLSAADKSAIEASSNELKSELMAKTFMTNLVPEIEQIRANKGVKHAGMSQDMFNSAVEASAAIDSGLWNEAVSQLGSYDVIKRADTQKGIEKNTSDIMFKELFQNPIFTSDSVVPIELKQEMKGIVALRKAGDHERAIAQMNDVVDKWTSLNVKETTSGSSEIGKQVAATSNTMMGNITIGKGSDYFANATAADIIKTMNSSEPVENMTTGRQVKMFEGMGEALVASLSDVQLQGSPHPKVSKKGANFLENALWLMGRNPDGSLDSSLAEYKGTPDEEVRVKELSDSRIANIDLHTGLTQIIPREGHGRKAEATRENFKKMLEYYFFMGNSLAQQGVDADGLTTRARTSIPTDVLGQLNELQFIKPTPWN